MSLNVTPALRAADPLFASMCDSFNELQEMFNQQKKLLDEANARAAALSAEVVTLRAQLSSRAA